MDGGCVSVLGERRQPCLQILIMMCCKLRFEMLRSSPDVVPVKHCAPLPNSLGEHDRIKQPDQPLGVPTASVSWSREPRVLNPFRVPCVTRDSNSIYHPSCFV